MKLDFSKELDSVIQEGLTTMNVPGAALAVVKDDAVIYHKAFGFADLGKKLPMNTEHILPIGSITKSFTATAAALLAGEGKLDLDVPIRTYMPALTLHDPVATLQATTRDLLCHRTGLPRHDFVWIGRDDISRQTLVLDCLRHLSPNKPFRSVWQYQNLMYSTVGFLIEQITGLTWEDFVAQRLLEPLGIRRYQYGMPADSDNPEIAKLYMENRDGCLTESDPYLSAASAPAGAICSTTGEIAKWLRFHLAGGKVNDRALLEPSAIRQLYKLNIPFDPAPLVFSEKRMAGYGMGWFAYDYKGFRLLEHGGNVFGGTALASMIPEKNIGCVILTNANSTLLTYALSSIVFDRLLGASGSNWIERYHLGMISRKEEDQKTLFAVYNSKISGTAPSHATYEYTGAYYHPGYGEIQVNEAGKGLEIHFRGTDFQLEHLHYDIFTFEMVGIPFAVQFHSNIKGGMASITIQFEENSDPILFSRKAATQTIN